MNYYDILLAKKLEDDRDPKVEGLSVTENGRYAEDGVVYSPVIVNVPSPILKTKTITSNNTYRAADDNADGYSEVTVNVPLPSNGYLLESASGAIVTVTDAAPLNLQACEVDIEPSQDLHGYSKPWVGGAGKNKLPMTVDGIKSANTSGTWSGNAYTWRGITYELITDTDGNITQIATSGTATDLSYLIVANSISVSQEIILNGCPSGGSYSNSYSLALVTSNGSLVVSDDGNGVNISNSYSDVNVRIYFRNGTNGNNKVFYPMIRLATETDATFAPYSNICPIRAVTETGGEPQIEIKRVGKNQWDEEWEVGNIDNVKGGTTSDNNRWRCKNFIPVTPNRTYYFKSTTDDIGIIGYDSRYVAKYVYYNNSMVASQYTTSSAKNKSILMPADCYFIKIKRWSSGSATYNQDISINYPSTDTDYYAYQGETYIIKTGSNIYGGTLDATTGKFVVDKGIKVYNGSESWNTFTSNPNTYYTSMPSDFKAYGHVISNGFKQTYSADVNMVNGEVKTTDTNAFFKCDTCPTDTEWKTWLASNPLQVCYELATPQTIQLTPTQIKLLQGNNTLYATSGNLAIEYFGKGV